MTNPVNFTRTAEEVVAMIESCDKHFGDDGWHVERGELAPLIYSWRLRGFMVESLRAGTLPDDVRMEGPK